MLFLRQCKLLDFSQGMRTVALKLSVIGIMFSVMYVIYIRTWNEISKERNSRGVFSVEVKSGVSPERYPPGMIPIQRKLGFSAQSFTPMELTQKKHNNFDYKKVLAGLNKRRVSADNPELVQIIRNYYIEPPSRQPYNLLNPHKVDYSRGQTPFVDSRLNYMEGGFYIECGALNGEYDSNTLFLEKVRKWNGLLIEAGPDNYAELKTKHRKAFSINACLSPRTTPSEITFNQGFNKGRLVHDSDSKNWIKRLHVKSAPVKVQCFPLYSILLAMNQTTVDFFSLDVEGDELKVLRTIPFDKVNIKMLTVENAHVSHSSGNLQTFMESKGYDTLLKMKIDGNAVNDYIFRKKGLTH